MEASSSIRFDRSWTLINISSCHDVISDLLYVNKESILALMKCQYRADVIQEDNYVEWNVGITNQH